MPSADKYRKIFEAHGYETGRAVATAIESGGKLDLTPNTIYTGLNKMLHGTAPSPKLVDGLRHALGYDPKLDELLHRDYGIEPAERPRAPRKGPSAARSPGSKNSGADPATPKPPASALSRMEQLLAEAESRRTEAGAAADEALEEVLEGIRSQYKQHAKTPEEKIGFIKQYRDYGKKTA